MIDRTHTLPVVRQCQLLKLARSTASYQPRSVSDTALALMRRIDELQLQYPFAGARMLRDLLRQEGHTTVRRPRVRDLSERFESKILPLFTRRTEEVGTLLPALSLHGLSTGDFELARRGLLGEGAPLSANSIQRLKVRFELEYKTWIDRDLSNLAVGYWWADGLYVKAGIADRKSALLTVVGALTTGEKIVLA